MQLTSFIRSLIISKNNPLNSPLPDLYNAWILNFLPGPLPEEKRATCSDCAMCKPESIPQFDPKTKCCTYIPAIPNFLAGVILQKDGGLLQSYWERADVRPQGIWPDAAFVSHYHPLSQWFGRQPEWRCPYYMERDGGLCGIWENRNARCATWFCKHTRGPFSYAFWAAVEQLLNSVERSLAHWCMVELRAGSEEFREAFPVRIGTTSLSIWFQQQHLHQSNFLGRSDEMLQQMWGKWLGREQQFFQECSRIVFPLQWIDVRTICGAGIQTMEQDVLQTYAHLKRKFFPEILKLADFHHSDLNEDEIRVWTVNPYDVVTLSNPVFRLLHRCSGMKITEVEKQISRELLIQLFDAGILAP